jgi:hypothetical protein
VVAAWFKRDVERAACCEVACPPKCNDLGMWSAYAAVKAASCKRTGGIEHDAADEGIGFGATVSTYGEFGCAVEPEPINRGVHRNCDAHV